MVSVVSTLGGTPKVWVPNTGEPGVASFNRYFFAQQDKLGAAIDPMKHEWIAENKGIAPDMALLSGPNRDVSRDVASSDRTTGKPRWLDRKRCSRPRRRRSW